MGQSKEYQDYIASEKWLTFATDAKVATGGRCQGCDRKTWNLQVHHLTYERLGNELPSDVWVVCAACHLKFHPKHKKRVNNERKKQGKAKIRGTLGLPRPTKKKKWKPAHTAKKNIRSKMWSDAERAAMRGEADKKLGPPTPCADDFRNKLLAGR